MNGYSNVFFFRNQLKDYNKFQLLSKMRDTAHGKTKKSKFSAWKELEFIEILIYKKFYSILFFPLILLRLIDAKEWKTEKRFNILTAKSEIAGIRNFYK